MGALSEVARWLVMYGSETYVIWCMEVRRTSYDVWKWDARHMMYGSETNVMHGQWSGGVNQGWRGQRYANGYGIDESERTENYCQRTCSQNSFNSKLYDSFKSVSSAYLMKTRWITWETENLMVSYRFRKSNITEFDQGCKSCFFRFLVLFGF